MSGGSSLSEIPQQNRLYGKEYLNMSNSLDFIGFGGQKCATSWIFHNLDQHPGVSFGKRKELRFFHECNYIKGIDWYLNELQVRKGVLNGDITPGYLTDPVVPARIAKHFPNVRLFACLRNPVDRAFSAYRYSLQLEALPDSFEEALKMKPGLVFGSQYAEGVRRYLDIFPPAQLLFFRFCDVKRRPELILERVLKHIGIENPGRVHPLPATNVSGSARSQTVSKLCGWAQELRRTSVGRIFMHGDMYDKASWRVRKVIRRFNTVNSSSPVLEYDVRKRVFKKYFQKDVEFLASLTGLDLSDWIPGR